MKFAHSFKDILQKEEFPSHWVEQAIPYRKLKKRLKEVEQELRNVGLCPETLRLLRTANDESSVVVKYKLDVPSSSALRPSLIVSVNVSSDAVKGESSSATSRAFLRRLSDRGSSSIHGIPEQGGTSETAEQKTCDECSTSTAHSSTAHTFQLPMYLLASDRPSSPAPAAERTGTVRYSSSEDKRIQVPLILDGQFFENLRNDVLRLDVLQSQEERNMTSEIIGLGQDIEELTKPSRFFKHDIGRWRAIFELYLDAQVFFTTREQHHGERSSHSALEQLRWFQEEVVREKLAASFKLPKSQGALVRFYKLNSSLVKILQFQELNRLAVSKILKKFDKRTSLGVAESFPAIVHSGKLMAESVAKDLCARISSELVSVVPQINDYICPVCFTIAYWPVRLACKHIFCIRCVVKMQRRKKRFCPLCRAEVLMSADARNVDEKLAKFLRRYFLKETREKQRANEFERGIEQWGSAYTEASCGLM